MEFKGFRDLYWAQLEGDSQLVVACDSLGGIGPMSLDVVSCPAEISGYFTTMVALSELLAYGASPVLVTDSLSFSMEPHGKEALQGVERALKEAGFAHCPVTGSTEENVPTRQTAMGITVLGLASAKKRKSRVVKPGDVCFLIGEPFMGDQVLGNLDKINTLENLQLFLEESVGDILPVGSKGIGWEMKELAGTHSLEWIPEELDSSLLEQSAGPATCFLVAGAKQVLEAIIEKHELRAMKMGTLR